MDARRRLRDPWRGYERLAHVSDHEHDHDGPDDHDHDHTLIVDRLPQGDWRVDPSGSEVLFRTKALFGLVPVNGLFERFSGQMQVDGAGAVQGALVIETDSIHTALARRDRDLRGPGYFNAAQYPTMTFTLEHVEPGREQQMSITGSLEICGTRIPMHFEAYAIAHGDHLHLEGRVLLEQDLTELGWDRSWLVGRQVRAEVALTLKQA